MTEINIADASDNVWKTVISQFMVFEWHHMFKNGCELMEDNPLSEQLAVLQNKDSVRQVLEAVCSNRHQSVQRESWNFSSQEPHHPW